MFKKMPFIEQVEAMQLIINIQTMQERIYKRRFSFEEFQGNSIAELRELQNIMITEGQKILSTEWNNLKN